MLLAAPALIMLRLKIGPKLFYLGAIAVWATFPVTQAFRGTELGLIDPWMNILFGTGSIGGGPSVIHGLIFLFAGAALAAAYKKGMPYFVAAYTGHLALGAVMATIYIDIPIEDAYWKFADLSYRTYGQPGYCIFGLWVSLTLVVVASVTIGKKTLPSRLGPPISLGTSSLFSFTLGNVLFNLAHQLDAQARWPLLSTAVILTIVVYTTFYKRQLPYYQQADDVLNLRNVQKAGVEAKPASVG